MNKELWGTVNEVFHAALDVPAAEREAWLSAAAPDPLVRAEVEGLLRADSEADSYLETPVQAHWLAPNQPPLQVGEVLCGRFRIVRFIAEGGMGHVFEAQDEELAVRVALKVIRPEIADHAEVLARFRQEVRLARQITHPNVVRTFDIDHDRRPGRADGPGRVLVFLTMEYLEGETLAARIKREGPLPLPAATAIATQVAAALAAAHRVGVVHRDVKPANIMLSPRTGSGEASGDHDGLMAVVTDFGLARLNPALTGPAQASSLGLSGNAIGTLAYMSPEQLTGAPVSPATDVYAFGLVLAEMLTGTRVFAEDTFLSGLGRRLQGRSPMATSQLATLPPRWQQAVERCLQPTPAKRFQDPGEAIALLNGTARSASSLPRHLRRVVGSGRRAALVALGGVLMAAFAVGLRYARDRPSEALPASTLLYLAPVQNGTGDEALNVVGDMLESSLAQSPHIRLLDHARADSLLRQLGRSPGGLENAAVSDRAQATDASFREVAMRAGAPRVLLARVTRAGKTATLHLDLQQPDADPAHVRRSWTQDFTWPAPHDTSPNLPAPALTALRSAANWLRHELGEPANDIAALDTPPEDVTTANWQALTDYSAAQGLLRSGGLDHKQQAIALLHNTVRLDPGFARAWADLGDNLVSLGERQQGYEAYRKALTADGGRRLSRKERDFIAGSFANDTRDYNTAVEAFRDLTAFYPKDYDGWFFQAFPLDLLDRTSEAAEVLRQATALAPAPQSTAGQSAYLAMLQGDYAAATQSVDLVRQSGRTSEADELTGILAFLEGRYELAGESFVRNQQAPDPDFQMFGYMLQIRLLAEQGRLTGAMKAVSNGLESVGSMGNRNSHGVLLLDRAALEVAAGMYERSLSDVEEALRWNGTADAAIVAGSLVGRAVPQLSSPERRRAIALMRAIEARQLPGTLVVEELARARLQGELLLAKGQPGAALAAFRKADSLDAPLAPRDYLARGLVAAAAASRSPAEARALREEALTAFARTALRPAVAWRIAWRYPPGVVAGQMIGYLNVARTLRRTPVEVAPVATAFARMRQTGGTTANPRSSPTIPPIERDHP